MIVVFDVETANFFTDPEVGWNNFEALKVSGIGAYVYQTDQYVFFNESEFRAAAEFLEQAELLVGFGISRYDIPVLNATFQKTLGKAPNLFAKNRVDLLDEVELVTGRRISLNRLAQANLGESKLGNGSEAIGLYREGKLDELKAYCLKDVELTKRLYDRYRMERYFLIPQRAGEPRRVEFSGKAGLVAHPNLTK